MKKDKYEMSLGDLYKKVSEVVQMLNNSGIDVSKLPVEFHCFDVSENQTVICKQIDTASLDFVKKDKFKIEIS